jgi:hypothetical protein
MNTAIAWKKSEAITALDPQLSFSLAMVYIRMAHADWIRLDLDFAKANFQLGTGLESRQEPKAAPEELKEGTA